MEALGAGLTALGSAISAIAGGTAAVCIVAICATTFLLATNIIELKDLKEFLIRDKGGKYR